MYTYIVAARGSSVAFTATSSTDGAHSGKVIFNTVVTNEGGAYDGSTGIFTCPSSGVYVFIWTIMTHYGKQCYADLSINGTRQQSVRAAAHLIGISSSDVFTQSTASRTVRLSKGQQVFVHVYFCTYFVSGRDNAFSGWKVWTQSYTRDFMWQMIVWYWQCQRRYHWCAQVTLSEPTKTLQSCEL